MFLYAGLDSTGGKYGELNEWIKLCCERRLEVKKRRESVFFLQEPALHRCLMGTRLWFLQDWKVGAATACSVIIWVKQACVCMKKTNMTTTVHYLLDEVISKQLVNWNVAVSGGRSCTMWDKKAAPPGCCEILSVRHNLTALGVIRCQRRLPVAQRVDFKTLLLV